MAADLAAECERYDRLIADLGGIDLQLLGIGHNGHIGFNEPGEVLEKGTHVVELKGSTVSANSRFFASAGGVQWRAITMGIQAVMAAKRDIPEQALHGPVTPRAPVSLLPDAHGFYRRLQRRLEHAGTP